MMKRLLIFTQTIYFFIFFAGDSDRNRKELKKVLKKHKQHRLSIFVLTWILISLIALVIIVPFVYQKFTTNPTTFNVTAITEQIAVNTTDVPMSSWPVNNIELHTDCQSDNAFSVQNFTGAIKLQHNVNVIFTRIAQGPLKVSLYIEPNDETDEQTANKNREQPYVGDLFSEDEEYVKSLADCAYFYVNDIAERASSGQSVVLPVTGEISVGNEVRFLTESENPVLREGEISILDRSFLIGEIYSVGPFNLKTGDSFKILQNKPVPNQGFVLANEDPALKLVFSAEGVKGVIKRYQSENYEIENSYWTKLFNDEVLSFSWVFIIILFNIIRVYLRYLVNENG